MTPTLDTFVQVLKEQLAAPKADLEHNIRAVLAEMVEKMDLVSKEELDRQKTALEHANQRMNALQQQIESLQNQIKK